jgi:hypothetical protein
MRDENYIKQLELWIAATENNIAQCEAAAEYDKKEIWFHQKSMENQLSFAAHYREGIEQEKKKLQDYLEANPPE